MTTIPLNIELNARELLSALGEFSASLKSLIEFAPELIESMLNLFESSKDRLFVLESDDISAVSTGELIVILKPSNCLLGLMAAARTRDIDRVRQIIHENSPVVDVAVPSEDSIDHSEEGSESQGSLPTTKSSIF